MRAPAGTPFYQGFHNFWSKNWVADRENPPDPPELGEVTAGNGQYSTGVALFTAPAVTVGSADCISAGENYPPDSTGVVMYDGIPSSCWQAAQLPTPFPKPLLWFKPDNIVGLGPQINILAWGDYGTAVDAAISGHPNFPPYVSTQKLNGWPLITLTNEKWFNLGVQQHLYNTFMLYIVGVAGLSPYPGLVSLQGETAAIGQLPTVLNTRMGYVDPFNQVAGPYTFTPGEPYIIKLQRNPSWVSCWFNGRPVFNGGTNLNGQANLYKIYLANPGAAQGDVAEIIVFREQLDNVQDVVVLDYLLRKFGLTL